MGVRVVRTPHKKPLRVRRTHRPTATAIEHRTVCLRIRNKIKISSSPFFRTSFSRSSVVRVISRPVRMHVTKQGSSKTVRVRS